MKKLSLLLAICLVVTMLPGIGYTEDDPMSNGHDLQVEAQLSQGDLELGLPNEDESDDVLIDGDLDINLDVLGETIGLLDDFEDIELTDGDDEAAAENAGESSDSNPAGDGSVPYADPDGPKLDSNEMTLGINDYRYLISDNRTGEGVTYFSSDSSIAKVYKSGRVTGMSEGFAVVSAANDDGAYSECFVYVKKAPVEVSFGVDSLVLGKGEYYRDLKVSLGEPAEEYGGTYTLSSENSSVVKVKSDNVLKGAKTGSTRIKVETYNGLKGTLEVTVKKAPEKITLSVDKPVLGVGEKGKVSYKLSKDSAGEVTLTSENPDIVTVDSATGTIQGLAQGETRIHGVTFNGKEGFVTVTVAPAPQAVAFESDSLKLGVGMKLKVGAVLDDGAAGAITYNVADSDVASCTDGVVKGLKNGNTILTAKTYNGLRAECAIEVVNAPAEVRLPWSKLDIGVNESVRLEPDVGSSASTFTYSTSNAKVVKVDSDGTITGVKKGTATITVKTYNGKKCKLKVTVVKSPDSVELFPDSLELGVGETAALTWSFPQGTSAGVSFESSDPAVAAVDPLTGVVTGVSGGRATITVTTSNGKTDQTDVTVLKAPEWIKFTEDQLEIGVSQTHRLTVEM